MCTKMNVAQRKYEVNDERQLWMKWEEDKKEREKDGEKEKRKKKIKKG